MVRRSWALAFACSLVAVLVVGHPALAGGGGCGERPTAARGDRVNIRDSCIRPTVLHANPGDEITWKNRDAYKHVVNGANLRWGTFRLRPNGGVFRHSFENPGVYPYSCFLHPGMNGAVVVGEVETPDSGGPGSPGLADGSRDEGEGSLIARVDGTTGSRGARSRVAAVGQMAAVVLLGSASLYALLRIASRRQRPGSSRPSSG